MFTLDFSGDVYKTRNEVIEKLEEQDEVEKTLKLFVNNFETYVDRYNVHWKAADIILSSKIPADQWKEDKFKKVIFQKCYLRETFTTINGEISREFVKRRRQEKLEAERRGMGNWPV